MRRVIYKARTIVEMYYDSMATSEDRTHNICEMICEVNFYALTLE